MKLINVKRGMVINEWRQPRKGDGITKWLSQGWQTENMIKRTLNKRVRRAL